jgi:hypothetical protein
MHFPGYYEVLDAGNGRELLESWVMEARSRAAEEGGTGSSDRWIGWNTLDVTLFTSQLSGASLISGTVTYPFWVLTTRQQAGFHITGDAPVGSGIGLRTAYKNLGLRGLFRGVVVSNVLYCPAGVGYLLVTEHSRHSIRSFMASNPSFANLPVQYVDAIQAAYSAVLANFTNLLISSPSNVVASKLVTQKQHSNLGFTQVARNVYNTFGLRGFYHGFSTVLAQGAIYSAVWWFIYTAARRASCPFVSSGNADGGDENDRSAADVLVDGACGLVTGVSSAAITHPLDTIGARIMTGSTTHTSFLGAFRDTVRSPLGLRALYIGVVPSMMSATISSTIFAVSYEFIKRSSSR